MTGISRQKLLGHLLEQSAEEPVRSVARLVDALCAAFRRGATGVAEYKQAKFRAFSNQNYLCTPTLDLSEILT
ncbi:MAG: hypothetical protein KAF91_16900, partial [Nostoc sp. TH1S01]|nr:hypothetical protein [Nostoc sp. TH1S01]